MECYDPRLNVPKSKMNMVKPWETGSFCGNMNLSNIQTKPDGAFLNIGENMYSDRQGLWANYMFNVKQEPGVPGETYSNLQGSWSRVGPSTYDALHAAGDPHNRWAAGSFLPQPLKSLYDHRNVDPKGMWRPEHFRQSLPY